MVDALLEAKDDGSDHILLADGAAFDAHLIPAGSRPNFDHSALVDAHVVTLNRKAPNLPSKLAIAIQGLVVEMQGVRKGDTLDIAEADRNTLQIEIGLIFGCAKLTAPAMCLFEIESRNPTRIVFA